MLTQMIELSNDLFEDMLEAIRRDLRCQLASADIPETGNGFLMHGFFAHKDIRLLEVLRPKHASSAYEAAHVPPAFAEADELVVRYAVPE